jgi:hypothetical protein
MHQILAIHAKIYSQFQGSKAGPEYFFKPSNADAYAAYYNSMFLIADTGESVAAHMKRDFSADPLSAYIEFWGVMQAIFIQQDAICELHKVVVGSKPQFGTSWACIRDIRNICAGHPANRSATQRTFMGRNFGNYARIQYELWDAATNQRTNPTFNLETKIKAYDAEAATILNTVLVALKAKWP